jgi:hypothetical protein
MVLRSLAAQNGPAALDVTVHLHTTTNHRDAETIEEANALLDLCAGTIHFDHDAYAAGVIHLRTTDGRILEEWKGFQNAATLGGAVRARLGAPHFAAMRATPHSEGKQ